MRELSFLQGSSEWLSSRRTARGASEAPVIMGASKYQKRTDLIKQKATGIVPEVDECTKRLFDRGHATEAAARMLIEAIIGQDLFPVVATDNEGYLTASFDGVDILATVCFEHKLLSDSLLSQVRSGELEPHYYWQLEQQLYVSGAEKVIFATSNGTEESLEWMEYRSVPGRIEQLLAAWKQFDLDVAEYEHTELPTALVAEVVKDLPAVMVRVSGSVSIIDNFGLFESALRDFIDNKLVRSPQTDQDFADLDEQIKALKRAEDALDAAEVQMIAQVSPVDAMKRTKDMLHKLARDNRLMAEKLLKAEKGNRKVEIVTAANRELSAHLVALQGRVGVLVDVGLGFADAIKGLKSLDSMRDKISAALANAKIEANAIADRVDANRKAMGEHAALFPDFTQVCTKAPDDFAALVAMRVAQQKERDDKRLEAEREKIRAEEQAKADAERLAAMPKDHFLYGNRLSDAQVSELLAENKPPIENHIEQPLVMVGTGKTIKLGEINAMLAPVSINADGLASLGILPVAHEKNAKLYDANKFPTICRLISEHVMAQAFKKAA